MYDDNVIFFFDLFGTFIFAATGAVKAVKNKLDLLGVLFFAVTVGCGGGMLRDVFLKEIPIVFTSDFYASASILGGLFGVFLLKYLKVDPESVITITAAVTMTLRIIAYEMHFRLPVAKFDKGDDD